jgi:hypothetical protein
VTRRLPERTGMTVRSGIPSIWTGTPWTMTAEPGPAACSWRRHRD